MSEYIEDLIRWEGLTTWLYRDSRGHLTTGIGHLVPDLAAAIELPWFIDGEVAAADEIREDVRRVALVTVGTKASAQEHLTRCRLTEQAARELAEDRLEDEFLPALALMFPGFHGLPLPARRCLVDMAWNLGTAGLAKFHALQRAVDACDWPRAAIEAHVATSRQERNDWRAGLMLSCDGPPPSPATHSA